MRAFSKRASLDVVVIGSMWWSGHQLTDQRLTRALSELGLRVLYVNPSYTPILGARRAEQGGPGRLGLTAINPGLKILSPVGLPLRSRPGIASVNSWLTALQIAGLSVFRMSRQTRFLIFSAHPSLVSAFRPWRRVAVVKDDYAAGAGLIGQDARIVDRRRRVMLNRASAVIAVSQSLAQSLLKQGFRSTVIPPGVSVSGPEAPAPGASNGSAPPRALFSGLISDRIDLSVLRAVVDSGWTVTLVGGVQPTFQQRDELDRLLARGNVVQLGWRSPEEVQAIARSCDAGLLPYTLSAFNRASSPLKTLEYLAAGLPVVATALPSVLELGSPDVHVVSAVDDVAPLMRRLDDRRDDEQARRRRVEFATANSWTARAQSYLAVLNP